MICECPEYRQARADFLEVASPMHTLNTLSDILSVLSSSNHAVVQALGSFLARTRQARRRLKLQLEKHDKDFTVSCFSARRAAWRLRGKPSCRHGVLFSLLPVGGCRCMTPTAADTDWQGARFMPALNHDLKTIVAKKFRLDQFVRLSILQNQARALGW